MTQVLLSFDEVKECIRQVDDLKKIKDINKMGKLLDLRKFKKTEKSLARQIIVEKLEELKSQLEEFPSPPSTRDSDDEIEDEEEKSLVEVEEPMEDEEEKSLVEVEEPMEDKEEPMKDEEEPMKDEEEKSLVEVEEPMNEMTVPVVEEENLELVHIIEEEREEVDTQKMYEMINELVDKLKTNEDNMKKTNRELEEKTKSQTDENEKLNKSFKSLFKKYELACSDNEKLQKSNDRLKGAVRNLMGDL